MLLEICDDKHVKYSNLCTVWTTSTSVGMLTVNHTFFAVGLQAEKEILKDKIIL